MPTMQDTTPSTRRTSADFLTLVAAQERRVLELREELAKADAELTSLKRQWAIYEANKKREEVRQVKRMVVPMDEVPSPTSKDKKDVEEERRRRRALVEMTNNANGHAQADTTKLGRRGSKRVFEGKHTRTLSLLSPSSTKPASGRSIDELVAPDENRLGEDASGQQLGTPSLSRMPTLDGLVSPDNLQLGFGTTYKDLATHRRSLPPAAADIFMKQGRQVVDGMREGLWTFFEDIRQATVGDEAVNGPVRQQRHSSRGKHPEPKRRKSKPGKTTNRVLPQDDAFWKEFGLETPQKNVDHEQESRAAHVQQKSSTDSQNPPDLLEDAGTHGDEHEDDWDNWESPKSARKGLQVEAAPLDSDGLPWPELKKLTPSKLNRTASDLMREWRDGEEGEEGRK